MLCQPFIPRFITQLTQAPSAIYLTFKFIYHMSLRGISSTLNFETSKTCFVCISHPQSAVEKVGYPHKGPEVLGVSVIMRRTTTSGAPFQRWKTMGWQSPRMFEATQTGRLETKFDALRQSYFKGVIYIYLSFNLNHLSWYPEISLVKGRYLAKARSIKFETASQWAENGIKQKPPDNLLTVGLVADYMIDSFPVPAASPMRRISHCSLFRLGFFR